MSRDSGAGAYSHGIAWPSPRPQLDGARSGVRTMLDEVSVAMAAIMALGRSGPRDACLEPRESGSAAIPRHRIARFAIADMQVVVVAAEPRRETLTDQDRVVEVDELHVAGCSCPDGAD